LRNDGRVWVPKKKEDCKKSPREIPEDDRDYYLERMYPAFGNLAPRDIASRAAKVVCDEGRGIGETGLGVYLDFADAINRLGRTKLIDVRHEQAGTHAADGYARATGKLGVMIASTGPGPTNTVTGLYEARYASSPVLVITGQAETAFYGKGLSYVHEAEAQLPMLRTVARRVESPRHVSTLRDAFVAVVKDMRSGRPAPGALEIPIDLQYAEAAECDFPDLELPEFAPEPRALAALVERIAAAKRRVIVAGGGVIAAEGAAALTALAERLDAPVITTVDGRGAIPEDHPLCVGN